MATTRGSLFDPTLVKDLVSKVTGKSSLATDADSVQWHEGNDFQHG